MRVLITGATGFLGAWKAKAVADRGHRLRLLVRDPDKLAAIATAVGFDASDVVVGDMTDSDRVAAALQGCDAVIHAAAVVALRPGEVDRMIASNLAGAKNVVGQAVERGIDPVVHVSSATALWHRRCPLLHAGLSPCGGGDDYAESKVQVEHYIRELQRCGAPIAVTYPWAVIGPAALDQYGESGEAIGAFIRSGVLGRGAAVTIADVRDVAEVHARLLEAGLGPRRYVLGGHRLSGAELATQLTRITGRRVRHLPVPDALLIGAGRIADRFRSRLPESLSKLSEAGTRYLTDVPPVDNSPAQTELGITFRPATEALEAMLADRARRRQARQRDTTAAPPRSRPDDTEIAGPRA